MTAHILDLYSIFHNLSHELCDAEVEKIFNEYQENNKEIPDTIILAFHHDYSFPHIDLFPYALTNLSQRINAIGVTDIHVTLDHVMCHYHYMVSDYKVTYLHGQLMFLDYYTQDRKEVITNNKNNKFLLLAGQLPKPQRIGLLVELWKNSILSKEKAIITVAAAQFENPNSAQRLQQMVQDDKIFANFIADLKQNSIDPIENYTDVDTDYARIEGFTKSMFKCFDLIPHLHADTRFSVITESHVDASIFHTEKVWKAILNKHAFIIAASANTLASLRQLGLKTFEKYLTVPSYDTIEDLDLRLLAVAKNTKGLLELPDDQWINIQKDVEHNYIKIQELIQYNYDQLGKLFNTTNIPFTNNYDAIRLVSSVRCNLYENPKLTVEFSSRSQQAERAQATAHSWALFYNDIKGADWPIFCSEEDVDKLPQHIQQEIKQFQLNN